MTEKIGCQNFFRCLHGADYSGNGGEFTLCGFAFDVGADHEDYVKGKWETVRFARPGQQVSCMDCIEVIHSVYDRYTRGGVVKK